MLIFTGKNHITIHETWYLFEYQMHYQNHVHLRRDKEQKRHTNIERKCVKQYYVIKTLH